MKTEASSQIELKPVNGYTLPPQSIVDMIGVSDSITSAFCHAHGVCDRLSNLQHYGALIYPARYAITEGLKEYATAEYGRMKADKIESIGNKLVFVGMGSSYESRYENDVCNHRIRTEIVNPEGRRFFIEVGTWGPESMRFDFVIDRDQQIEYETKQQEYFDKIQAQGGFIKFHKGDYLYDQHQKYSQQPYYWYKKQDWHGAKPKYTTANVLKWVNQLFGCNFTEMEVCNYLLTTDDYSSISPAN